MNAALNLSPPCLPGSMSYERVFSAVMDNIGNAGIKTVFADSFYRDLRLLTTVSAWALENRVMTSAKIYEQMRTLLKEMRDILDNREVTGLMKPEELERLREACLDYAEIVCGIGIQRDRGLYELLTGQKADGFDDKAD